MCIRDSLRVVQAGAAVLLVLGGREERDRPQPAVRADVVDAEPVSYTHLRAHETVLDLVCRLLLEKKK